MMTALVGVRGAVVDLHRVRLSRAGELGCASRDGDLGAELLRLRVGARRQLLARDAGREAQIVFDPRTGTRLSARRHRLEHQHVEAFGGGIHRRRQAGRSGADDHHVAQVCLVDDLVETQTVRDLLVGRIFQRRSVATDDHGHVVDGHVKPIEQVLRAGLALEVDVLIGMAVPRQELLDSKRARRMIGSNQHDIADALRDQLHPAEDERPHQDFAQLAVGLHQRQQMLAIDLDELRRPRPPAGARTRGGPRAC